MLGGDFQAEETVQQMIGFFADVYLAPCEPVPVLGSGSAVARETDKTAAFFLRVSEGRPHSLQVMKKQLDRCHGGLWSWERMKRKGGMEAEAQVPSKGDSDIHQGLDSHCRRRGRSGWQVGGGL